MPVDQIFTEEVKRAIGNVKRELRHAEDGLKSLDATAVYTALEAAQMATFEAKDLFHITATGNAD